MTHDWRHPCNCLAVRTLRGENRIGVAMATTESLTPPCAATRRHATDTVSASDVGRHGLGHQGQGLEGRQVDARPP